MSIVFLSFAIFIHFVNILVIRNRKSGNLESEVPVLGNRLFCAWPLVISMGILVKVLPHLRCVTAYTNILIEIMVRYAHKWFPYRRTADGISSRLFNFANGRKCCICEPTSQSVRAHCSEFQCITSACSVHAFRKAAQSLELLDYETHIVVVWIFRFGCPYCLVIGKPIGNYPELQEILPKLSHPTPRNPQSGSGLDICRKDLLYGKHIYRSTNKTEAKRTWTYPSTD